MKQFAKLLAGCAILGSTNAQPNATTLDELAGSVEDLSTLVTLVGAAAPAVAERLTGDAESTVFAPNNGAFSAALEEKAAFFTTQTDEYMSTYITSILLNHVVDGTKNSEDLRDGAQLTTLGGETLNVGIDGESVTFSFTGGTSGALVGADNQASNGVAHIIGGVLVPASLVGQLNTTVEAAGATDELSFVVGLIANNADALALLNTPAAQGFTVFAPTNGAFDDFAVALLGEGNTRENLDLSDEQVLATLQRHVVVGVNDAATLGNVTTIATSGGVEIPVGDVLVTVTTPDVKCLNGIVHIVNRVIPEPTEPELLTLAALAGSVEDLSTLVTLVGAAAPAVAERLTGDAESTVFAPNNGAFSAALGEKAAFFTTQTDEYMSTYITSILLNHVVDGTKNSEDLNEGDQLTTLGGETLNVGIDGESVTFSFTGGTSGALVGADNHASNGVAHIIGGVLVPASLVGQLNTIVEAAGVPDELSFVVGLIATNADALTLLNTPAAQGFTVFAPTNGAFDDLAVALIGEGSTREDLSSLPADLVLATLLRHVVVGVNDAATLGNVATIETSGGVEIPVGDVLVTVTTPDVKCLNGIVHIVNTVIPEPTEPEAPTTSPTENGAASIGALASLVLASAFLF